MFEYFAGRWLSLKHFEVLWLEIKEFIQSENDKGPEELGRLPDQKDGPKCCQFEMGY